MTRKKWNRLRRQRPELFSGIDRTAWESISEDDRQMFRRMPKSRVIATLTAWVINDKQPLYGVESPKSAERRAVIHNLVDAEKPYLPEDLEPIVYNPR